MSIQDKIKQKQRKNWASDNYSSILTQRNFFLFLLIITLASISFTTSTLIKLTQEKSIEPFVIELKEKTGIVTVIRPFLPESFANNKELHKYFIIKYLTAREGYNYFTYDYDYHYIVRLLSSPSVYRNFYSQVKSSNTKSPHAKLKDEYYRDIQITSWQYSEIKNNLFTINVRFSTLDKSISTNRTISKANWIVTIKYQFADLQLNPEERIENPVGLQVIEYNKSKDLST